MKPERWQVIEELYHSASDLPNGQRNSFLQEACGEDQSLLEKQAMAIMAKAMAVDESNLPHRSWRARSSLITGFSRPSVEVAWEWCIRLRISSCGVWSLLSRCRSSWLRTHKLCTGSSA